MTDSRQPHREEPWGQAPQSPPGPGRPENGPQPRQGGPPPDVDRRSGRSGSYQNPYAGEGRRNPPARQAWEDPRDPPPRPDSQVWPDPRHRQDPRPWPDEPDPQPWPDQTDPQPWAGQRHPQPGAGQRHPQPWPDQPQPWPDQPQPWTDQPQPWTEQPGPQAWADPQDPRHWQDRFGGGMGPQEFDPRPRRGTGLVVALSVGLAVVLLGGGAVGVVSYVNATGAGSAPAEPRTKPSLPTSAPWQSDEPTDEPAQDQVPDEGTPTDEPTGPAVEPTDSPSDSGRPEAGSGIAHTEFDDWRFEWEGVRFSAKKVGGWTYETCDPVDGHGVLAGNQCRRAIQVAYTAYRGHLKAVQVTMAFPSEKAAKAAAARLAKLDSSAVNTRRDMTFPTFAYGKFLTHPSKNYVVTTLVTADETARSRALKFHAYLHANGVGHFLLRDQTVTT
ncbi:hypothetical protein OUY22_13405 [Nonomuraea sp. MCN248]|uniref:Uncharacterized protein n=1 Tax=Nonomuraea corallina TaxID=2989783 RepID=A0ABT4SBR3_9ACTN|nr:hypothetical protein [Nonomuraea corallina]MDA0634415.1 hypothetical protein [Nonomuraea corallina]